MSFAEANNIQLRMNYQFLLHQKGQPGSRIHTLWCPGDITYDEFFEKVTKLTKPIYLALNPPSRATTPVYGAVHNIQFRANGRTHNIVDQDGLARACGTIAMRQHERNKYDDYDGWKVLLITFEVSYPESLNALQGNGGFLRRLERWSRA